MTDHRQLPTQEQLFRDADVFWLREETQCVLAAFAADAALFMPSSTIKFPGDQGFSFP
jgi:hypothetical protein